MKRINEAFASLMLTLSLSILSYLEQSFHLFLSSLIAYILSEYLNIITSGHLVINNDI